MAADAPALGRGNGWERRSMTPLHGLKVLEFGQFIAGPYCGQLFADFGADVVKIEPPEGGDAMR